MVASQNVDVANAVDQQRAIAQITEIADLNLNTMGEIRHAVKKILSFAYRLLLVLIYQYELIRNALKRQAIRAMRAHVSQSDDTDFTLFHLGIVAEVCDAVAVMYAGRIVEQGTLQDIFENTKHPYTEGLFNSLPNIKSRTAMLKPIKGLMPDPTEVPTGCAFAPRCDYATEECSRRRPELTQAGPTHKFACLAYEREGFHIKRGNA